MGIIVDLIIIAVVLLFIFLGYKKGLTGSLIKLLSFIIAIVVAFVLYKPVANAVIENTVIDDNIRTTLSATLGVEDKTENTEETKKIAKLSVAGNEYDIEKIEKNVIRAKIGSQTSNNTTVNNNVSKAAELAMLINSGKYPVDYKVQNNRFVYSDITTETLRAVIIGLSIIALIMAICMMIKFKKNGLMGVIADIGFTAVLLLAIRYGNVEISLAGIFAIAIAVIVEYIVTGLILNEYSKKCEKEILIKNIKHLMGRIAICLVPFVVMAVTFALISWEEIASIGMILFWAIIIMIIYNTLMLVLKIFESNNENEKNKKESNHDIKKADNK